MRVGLQRADDGELVPPAAANTGGALPTPPTSTEPAPMAWSMGGPEVKSDHCALNGSLPIRPAAVSSACAPVPAWSPMCSVTSETSAWAALAVPAGLAVAPPAADEELDDEQPAASSVTAASAATDVSRRRVRGEPGRESQSVRYISIVLPW